jgi:hypothetical protein
MSYRELGAEKCIILMERLIIPQLIEWKEKPFRKPF